MDFRGQRSRDGGRDGGCSRSGCVAMDPFFAWRQAAKPCARPHDGRPIDVVTALVPPPHSRMSKYFWQLKSDLGFGLYVPDCDTTVCSISAATQFGSGRSDARAAALGFPRRLLAQVGHGNNDRLPTVTINDQVAYDGGIVSWIENQAGVIGCSGTISIRP